MRTINTYLSCPCVQLKDLVLKVLKKNEENTDDYYKKKGKSKRLPKV